ncbi:MAG: DNA polymerase III subunit [Phycisphaerales bacterium]|nr:MAG: DNA polymerase III subunit [Phycisphaerales bacterium]
MSLTEVKHQGPAQRTLQRALCGDRVHHAYIFHGPDGVGKEVLANGLAQVLLCSSPVTNELGSDDAQTVGVDSLRVGCGKCDDCRMVAAKSHPDLHLVYRQLNREHPDSTVRKRKGLEISVDVMRYFVIERVGLRSARGLAKVFIVREADRITRQAQNALLKTLEEPPGRTVLILLVRSLDRLLPTTLSRCQVVRFDPLPIEFVRGKLGELLPDLPPEQVEWYARCSEGSLGLAHERAGDKWYELNQRIVNILSALSGRTISEAIKTWTEESKDLGAGYRKRDPDITDTEATRRGLKAIFQLGATWYGDLLRCRDDNSPMLVNATHKAHIEEAAKRVDPQRVASIISRIVQAERQLDLNAYAPLVLETLLSDLAAVAAGDAASAGA